LGQGSDMSNNQIALISFLSKNIDAYPHQVSKIALEETHISWVILTGRFAYKIKKDLKFGQILDFSTLSLRKKFCQKEVETNKVLCGDMYIGVVKIVKQNKRGQEDEGGIELVELKNKGKALDYAVKMLEIPQKFRMDNLLHERKVTSDTIDKITSILVEFHRLTPTDRRIRNFGRSGFMKRKVEENFVTLSKLTNIDNKFERSMKLFINKKSKLFLQRISDDKIRDIHGDLYLKNIFIMPNNKLYLYDRIEFNDSLRYADVAEDVAHLAMDLDFHKRYDLRKHLISEYILRSKDTSLEDIVYFLMCYKACVRAKVSLFRAKCLTKINDHAYSDYDRKKRDEAVEEARRHLQLAESYLDLL
jgi:aminoglycoside phosphotransferase family enzyme